MEAAVEACRLRPIMTTSLASIAGAVPLVLASGTGAEVRRVNSPLGPYATSM